MGAAALREESQNDANPKFVGQVLGRPSPVLEFRAAERIATPPTRRVDPAVARAAQDADPQRDPSASWVRVSRRPGVSLRLPVLPEIVRHTRLDFAARARAPRPLTGLRLVQVALSVAAVLALLAAAALIVKRLPGDRVLARAAIAFSGEPGVWVGPTKRVEERPQVVDEGVPEVLVAPSDAAIEEAAIVPGSFAGALARKPAAGAAHRRTPAPGKAKTAVPPSPHKHAPAHQRPRGPAAHRAGSARASN